MVIRPVLVGDSRGMGRGSERRSIGSTGSLEGGGCLQTQDKCVSNSTCAQRSVCMCVCVTEEFPWKDRRNKKQHGGIRREAR